MQEVRVRVEDDGSLTVWVGGWRATFPAGGDVPACGVGAAPEDAETPPAAVLTAQRDGKTFVRYGDWIVVFGPGEPAVRPAKPDVGSNNVYLAGSPDMSSAADG